MALQSLNCVLAWPPQGLVSGTPAISGSTVTLDAAGEYQAVVCVAREDMTISHVGFRTGSVAGSPTGDVRIETVDSTGNPTGTLWATNTNIVTGTLPSNTFVLQALTAAASITKGQVFAIKIVYNSGTNFQLASTALISPDRVTSIPYQVTNITGSAVRSRLAQLWDWAVGNSATTFYYVLGLSPLTAWTNSTFSNSVAGAKRGFRFQVPFACRAVGLYGYAGTQTGDYNVSLMDDSGNELSSSSTAIEGTTANAVDGLIDTFFDNAVTLSPGVWYRGAFEPTSATNTQITTRTLPSADYRSANPGGLNFHLATFTTAGGWTDTTDQIPIAGILYDQLDDGVGSSGGPVGHQCM